MPKISHSPSRRGDPPRLNPNMAAYIRSSDKDEELPTRIRKHLGLDLRGDHLTKGFDTIFRGFFAEHDGIMLGVSRDVYDPIHDWEFNLHRYFEKIVLGEVEVPPADGPRMIDLAGDVLRCDGFCVNGVVALGLTLGRVALDVGERRHVMKLHRPGMFTPNQWEPLQLDLGGGVGVGPTGIVIRKVLSETVVAAMPGRRADVIIEHPALHRYEIKSISTRKKGHTVTVAKVPDMAPLLDDLGTGRRK